MKKLILSLLALASVSFLGIGCVRTDWGVARLPDARTLFITTAREQAFVAKRDLIIPYQPVGFFGIMTKKFQPCGGDITGMYTSLERAMAQEMMDKAKTELGGDAVVDFRWWVASSFKDYMASPNANVYIALVMYVLNENTVNLRGTVVKKK